MTINRIIPSCASLETISYCCVSWVFELFEPGIRAQGVSELSQEAKSPRSSFYAAKLRWGRAFLDLVASFSILVVPIGPH